MQTVHKFHLDISDKIPVKIPNGAEVLTVQMQKGRPYLWAVVETENPIVTRFFCMRGTGHAFNGEEGKYVGTFQAMGGDLVFHVFEEVINGL